MKIFRGKNQVAVFGLKSDDSVTTYTINPLVDPRWPDFLRRHPNASVFHSPGWLDALQRTYGYEPVVYTTSPPGTELEMVGSSAASTVG